MNLKATKTSTNYDDYIKLNKFSQIINASKDLKPQAKVKYTDFINELIKLPYERQLVIHQGLYYGTIKEEARVIKENMLSKYELEFIKRVTAFNASLLDIYYWTGKKHTNKKRLGCNSIRTILCNLKKDFDAQGLTKEFMLLSLYGFLIIETMRGKKVKQNQIRINQNEYLKSAVLYKTYAIKNPEFRLLALEMLTGRRLSEHRVSSFERVDIEETIGYLSMHYGLTPERVREFTWVKFTGQSKIAKNKDNIVGDYYIPLLYNIDFDEFIKLVSDFEENVRKANIEMGYADDLWNDNTGGLSRYRLLTREIIGGRKRVKFPLKINKMHNFRAIHTVIMGNLIFTGNTKFSEPGQIYTLLLGHSTDVERLDYEIVKLINKPEKPINFKDLNASIVDYVENLTKPTIKVDADRKFYAKNLNEELIARYKAIDSTYDPKVYGNDISKLRLEINRLKEEVVEKTGLSLVVLTNLAKPEISLSELIKLATGYKERNPDLTKQKRQNKLTGIVKAIITMKQAKV